MRFSSYNANIRQIQIIGVYDDYGENVIIKQDMLNIHYHILKSCGQTVYRSINQAFAAVEIIILYSAFYRSEPDGKTEIL